MAVARGGNRREVFAGLLDHRADVAISVTQSVAAINVNGANRPNPTRCGTYVS